MKKRYYWWYSSGHEFGGVIVTDTPEADDDGKASYWGPFDTLLACKQDAVDYFKTDIETAKNAIREIRSVKTRDILGW